MDPDGEETLSIDADVDDEVCATATLSESFTIANTDDDIASTSVSVASFIDGQPVQLEDGSTAFIYHKIKDSISNQLVQAIDLEDGTTAYIHHPNPSTSTSMTQTDLAIDEEKNTPNYRCDAEGCGKIYTTSHHLRVHKRTHTGEKPFVCGWKDCEKSFSTSYAVKSHIRVHTGEKPYDCNYPGCRKAFKTAGDLQKHNRTHTGEKPFKCPFEGCEKAFTTSNICKVHIRTHTGERPYKCPFPECDKAFATATNYKNHVRIHTGEKPFACEEPGCGKRFTEYSSFYKHQIVHAERNAYRCRQCGKFYSHTSTLLVHKRTIHNDESAIQECEMQMERRKPSKRPKMAKHIEPSIPVFEKKQIDKEETSDQHRMVLLPITTLENSTEAQASNSSQVAAVMTSESGQQLAILSHDGSTQQFTLALTDQGSTILLPNSDSSRTTEAESNVTLETPVKRENPILYIAGSGASGSILSAADKDNTLQRIEAIEHTSDSTPINTDIWLHQPQKEDIPEIQENRDNGIKNLVKEEENISVQFEPSTQNPCEDPANADSIAYLEIGGAKYQLKIVSSENDSISVDRPTLF